MKKSFKKSKIIITLVAIVGLLELIMVGNGMEIIKDVNSRIAEGQQKIIQGRQKVQFKRNNNKDMVTNGTSAYFISPESLGKLTQFQNALKIISPQIKIQKTTYTSGNQAFMIDQFNIQMGYNSQSQIVEIGNDQSASIRDGTIQMRYRFNYSVINGSKLIKRWGQGSVESDELMYAKQLCINRNNLQWMLKDKGGYFNLTITKGMKIQKIEPFNQRHVQILSEMLGGSSQNIKPSNVKSQLLINFNNQFFSALNSSLNYKVFDTQIDYSFEHPKKGFLSMTVLNHIYAFNLQKMNGYRIVYVNKIDQKDSKNEFETTCNITVPYEHRDFQTYGGIQSIHLNCFYQDVLNYYEEKRWLDTSLNSDWNVEGFSFKARDFYDFIGNLYTRVEANTLIEGQCKSNKNNLLIQRTQYFSQNVLGINIGFDCSMRAATKTGQILDILNFEATVKFYVEASVGKQELDFKILDSEVLGLTFHQVNNFIISDIDLAWQKANLVIQKNNGQKIFGSGYPILPMKNPKTIVEDNLVFYYDAVEKLQKEIKENSLKDIFNQKHWL